MIAPPNKGGMTQRVVPARLSWLFVAVRLSGLHTLLSGRSTATMVVTFDVCRIILGWIEGDVDWAVPSKWTLNISESNWANSMIMGQAWDQQRQFGEFSRPIQYSKWYQQVDMCINHQECKLGCGRRWHWPCFDKPMEAMATSYYDVHHEEMPEQDNAAVSLSNQWRGYTRWCASELCVGWNHLDGSRCKN